MTEPKPSEIPYLNVRMVDGLLGDAVAATGNRRALLQLRKQIDRALVEEGYPLDDAIYRDENGQEFEAVVRDYPLGGWRVGAETAGPPAVSLRIGWLRVCHGYPLPRPFS